MTRRVLITGAASGLGWELTRQYHHSGWHVILVDLDASKLEHCSDQLDVAFHSATAAEARDAAMRNTTESRHETRCIDLTNADQVAEMLDDVFQQPLDLLINNAGITHRSQASVTDPKVFSRLMAVNWFAPVLLTQKCLPALQQSRGSVICISSMAAKMPVPGRAAYCASKSAMSQHFETWRPELLNRGIALLLVYPSFLNTSIEANALGSDGNKTNRPRSTVGAIHSPDRMARLIIDSQAKGKQRLYSPQFSSRLAAWLWTRAPRLFQQLMSNKFADELT